MSACKETRRDGKSERTEGLIERERGTALDHLKSREASEIVIRYESLRGVTKKKNHDANVISSSPPGFLSISRSWSGLEKRLENVVINVENFTARLISATFFSQTPGR